LKLLEILFVRRHVLLAWLVLLVCATAAPAQEWARKMFNDTSHDFGNVARGAKAQYHFKFKNIYEETVHVLSIRSSCGCTTPEVTRSELKTWETSDVIATFNTSAFQGQHSATITVEFDKPFHAEVQLQVYGNIRSDVVLQPGQVELGSIDSGQPVEKIITVTHTGRNDWKITDVRSANTNFEVEVNETRRAQGSVTYDLSVRLKPTSPVGYINDQLFLMTNDPQTPQIPIDVEGRVVAGVEVNPPSLSLGALMPGQKVTKNIVVRSKRPFRVLDVQCADGFTCKVPDATREVQLIPITFKAGDQPGKLVKKIHIKTDLGENAVPDVTCQATILDSSDSAETASHELPTETSAKAPVKTGFRGEDGN
jgi:Protein of unknown function (DUF1573)